MDLENNKLLKQQIKQAYPTLNNYFIDLACHYCDHHDETEVEKMLDSISTDIINKQIEQTTFSVE